LRTPVCVSIMHTDPDPEATMQLVETRTQNTQLIQDRAARMSLLVERWLGARAATTVLAYSRDLEYWAGWMGKHPTRALADLLELDRGGANELVLAYRADMRASDLAPSTINRRLAALRSIVDTARALGLVGWALDVKGLKAVAYRDTRGPGVAGYRAMLDTLTEDTPQHVRDRAMLGLMYTMALRRAEVVGLDLCDVDLEGERLWILGKGRTQKESVFLPTQTASVLREWLAVRGPAPGPLFTSQDPRRSGDTQRLTLNAVTKRVRQIGQQAGVRVTPHGLRHAGITRALDLTNGDARRVRALSRHAKLETLMLYDDARTDMGGGVAALLAADA